MIVPMKVDCRITLFSPQSSWKEGSMLSIFAMTRSKPDHCSNCSKTVLTAKSPIRAGIREKPSKNRSDPKVKR